MNANHMEKNNQDFQNRDILMIGVLGILIVGILIGLFYYEKNTGQITTLAVNFYNWVLRR